MSLLRQLFTENVSIINQVENKQLTMYRPYLLALHISAIHNHLHYTLRVKIIK